MCNISTHVDRCHANFWCLVMIRVFWLYAYFRRSGSGYSFVGNGCRGIGVVLLPTAARTLDFADQCLVDQDQANFVTAKLGSV